MDEVLDGESLRRRLVEAGPWRHVDVRPTTGSTNEDALAESRPYSIVVAGEQTGGRGRRGRAWSSPPGTSIAMSMVLPTSSDDTPGERPGPFGGGALASDPGWVPLAVGLAVRDALAPLVQAPPEGEPGEHGAGQGAEVVLKWPNDVLVGLPGTRPGKVGGILCQMSGAASPLVVAGVGINVSVPRSALPEPVGTAPPATSLHLVTSRQLTRELVVEAIARQVAVRHGQWLSGAEGLEVLRADYAAACSTIGQAVDVHLPSDEVRPGVAVGLGPGGDLLVRRESGTVDHINAGDVVHIRAREGQY